MRISQLARNQKMMYQIANRGATSGSPSQIQSQILAMNNSASQSSGSGAANLMDSIGISGMHGRTAREMAQYQARVESSRYSQPTRQTGSSSSVSSAAQQYSRQQYIPISDEATADMQALALEDAKNSLSTGTFDSAGRAKQIQQHLQSVDPSNRAAAFNTMNKVWESELDRIGNFIKKNDSSWSDWGDKFDPSILDNYKPGVNVWV